MSYKVEKRRLSPPPYTGTASKWCIVNGDGARVSLYYDTQAEAEGTLRELEKR